MLYVYKFSLINLSTKKNYSATPTQILKKVHHVCCLWRKRPCVDRCSFFLNFFYLSPLPFWEKTTPPDIHYPPPRYRLSNPFILLVRLQTQTSAAGALKFRSGHLKNEIQNTKYRVQNKRKKHKNNKR